jgi:ATP-dependent Clp protease protease subunit
MKIELPFNTNPQQQQQNENEVPDVVTMFLVGEIKIDNATELCYKLKSVETYNRLNDKCIPIELYINSPGGDLYSSWMICDVMNNMSTPIQTIGMGQVASGGLIVFMNGVKGWRIATPNTQFMSHRFIAGVEASHHDLKHQQVEWNRTHERIIQHYKRCTGLNEKVIEKELLPEHNVWLTAEDCLKYKICDLIDNERFQPDEKIPKLKRKIIKPTKTK